MRVCLFQVLHELMSVCSTPHTVKYRIRVCQQISGRVELRDVPLVQDQYSVVVNDGLQAVGDRQDSRCRSGSTTTTVTIYYVRTTAAECGLNALVSMRIDGRCGCGNK